MVADITKANLAVTGLTASGKVYNANTTATLGGTAVIAVLGTDFVTLGGTASGLFADKNAGTSKTVTVSGYTLGGTDAGNYTLLQQTGLVADITKAALTITATGVNKVYDALSGATETLADNRVAGDVLILGLGSASYLDKNVANGKTVNVSGITLTGTDAGNYTFNTTAATTASITTKIMTLGGITAGNKVYDGTTAATVNTGAASYTGLVTGDAVTVSATGTFADKNAAASKAIALMNSYAGVDASNYNIINQGSTTADIAPATLMLTANPASGN